MDQATERSSATPALAAERHFPGESEMARRMRALDWSRTPLGPVESWSPSLRMMVRFLLLNRFPMLLWWGPEFLQFYNDAYRPVLGTKHPHYLARPVRECWSEIWDVIGPLIETPFHGGPATWMEDIQLEVNRHGFFEETHFTIAYSPVPDETAASGIGGVLATVHEISEKVVGERRVVALRDLGARAAEAKSAEEACQIGAATLARHAKDIPFALLYLLDPDGTRARLAATAGIERQDWLAGPNVIVLDSTSAAEGQVWPLAAARRTEAMQVVEDLAPQFATLPPGPWADPPTRAVVLPIRTHVAHQLAGFLVAGVSPRLRLDDGYAGFLELVSGQIASAIANARAYEEERRRAEALAAIDRAKTAFFSNVSHEFRTPLTLMLGPLEDSLADASLPPPQRERQRLIYRNGLRLLKLVNTLLDFARIEAGRVRASYEPTELAAYTAELASSFRSLVERAGMRLMLDCPPLEGAVAAPVYVDREMWEKIVLNLLSNAFKFTFAGEIVVALRPVDAGNAVELVVRDTGVGIPAAELPRVFERFHRVEGTRGRTYEGSGIGLALVQELAHLHGGTIGVESVEGAGTTFRVRLPAGAAHLPPERVRAPSALAVAASSAEAYLAEAGRWLPDTPADEGPGDAVAAAPDEMLEQPTAAARIVLADDNADMRIYLRRLLGGRYRVEAVANGAEALAAIRRERPDLVLADVMMPTLDGFGLLRALRAHPATVALPVMLLSARAGEEATLEGLEAGADDYLVKPFSAREVQSRVAARLEIARTRAEAERRTREALEGLLRMGEAFTGSETTGPGAEGAWRDGPPAPTASRTGQRILELTQRVLGCDVAGIVHFDLDTLRLAPVGLAGMRPEFERRWWSDVQRLTLAEFYRPDVVERLRAGQTTQVDLEAEPLLNDMTYGLRHIMLVPMRTGQRVMGLFGIEYHQHRPLFSDQEVALVEAIARLAALIIERERLQREHAAGESREMALRETARRMDEFLGVASHELRTPLTSITANVQLARRQLAHVGEQVARLAPAEGVRPPLARAGILLERTERQMLRLDRLVGDLLDVSRIRAGKLELRLEPCDLLAIARDTVSEQRAAWPERDITLDASQRARLPVTADPDRAGQVVTNLLTNALKYSPPDQPVGVRVRRHGAVARVEVRDHGPGLAADQRAHLFEQFYRVPGIEQQSGSGVGLGLGLHICKTIVERHGGRIGVDSVPGDGSTFWFTLPVSEGGGAARA